MMRSLALACCILLAGCGAAGNVVNSAATVAASTADAAGVKPPSLAGTTADEKAAIGLLYGYDAFLFVVDTLDAAGALPPSSPKVQRLADAIDATTAALRVAHAAQKAGNAKTFTEALERAKAAYALAQHALGSN